MALRNQAPESYELLDQRDEEQILAEIKGNIITEMFYSFKMDGREVTGISWVGTKEIARQYGGINMDFVRVDELPQAYVAVVKAMDRKSGTSLLGTAMQSKTMNTKAGEVDDRFAYTKAVSKAQRNAIRAIIPERFLIEMYEQFKKGDWDHLMRGKPAPHKQVDVEAKPVEGPKKFNVPEKPPAPIVDDEERRVTATLEANNLSLKDLIVVKYGKVIRVQPQQGFPQELFGEYDKMMKLLKGKWLGPENRWEVPVQ